MLPLELPMTSGRRISHRRAKRKEGPPARAALPLSGRGPVAKAIVCPSRVSPMAVRPPRRGPRQRRGSSSRMPATAAIDNETLDHLLSVVNDGPQYRAISAIRKPMCTTRRPGGGWPDSFAAPLPRGAGRRPPCPSRKPNFRPACAPRYRRQWVLPQKDEGASCSDQKPTT